MHPRALTPRQRTFLDKLLELHRDRRGPVHYTDVADRLGVNRFSAYDMLKVLEKKGFAVSSYSLAAAHSGPGRSTVGFVPTHQATTLLTQDRASPDERDEWASLRQHILAKLREARESGPFEAINELLGWLAETRVPLSFCTGMVGVLLLNMRRAASRAGALNPFRALAALRAGDDAGLESLAGLSVGATLSADDDPGRRLTQRLLEHAHRYQVNLSRLSSESRSSLAQFLEEALSALD